MCHVLYLVTSFLALGGPQSDGRGTCTHSVLESGLGGRGQRMDSRTQFLLKDVTGIPGWVLKGKESAN